MKIETFKKRLKAEAKNNDWVVLTDDKRIWGSQADIDVLIMGGGKLHILRAQDILNFDIWGLETLQCLVNNKYYTIEEIFKNIRGV